MNRHDHNTMSRLAADLKADCIATRVAAKEQLVGWAIEHMRGTARRMLRGFPRVKRWDQTDDVLQGAAIRLSRALDAVTPADGRQLFGLMALQVRRELLDLARKYGSEESFARHHDTNVVAGSGPDLMKIGCVVDSAETSAAELEAWTRFHEAVSRLADEERELFNLVWYLGLKQEDVARLCECSLRTAARRWEQTKRHLIEHLGGQAPA